MLIVRLANYLTSRGVENAYLTTSLPPGMADQLGGTEVIVSPKLTRCTFTTVQDLVPLFRTLRQLRKRFDVINIHNFPAELAVWGGHTPVVWMCNEPPRVSLQPGTASFAVECMKKMVLAFDRFTVKKYIRRAVVADLYNADRFEKLYGFRPAVIPYGIDHSFFQQGDSSRARKKYALSEHDFLCLQVGMITPYKNQLASVKAVERLRPNVPQIKLILAGFCDNAYARDLKRYITQHSMEQTVIVTGHLDRGQLKDLYHACDVLLHPVRDQGGWLTPFEALCARAVIVVSPSMTCSDIIRSHGLGIVTDDLEEAIRTIYATRSEFKAKAEKGCNWVKDNLNWDMFSQAMLDVFEESLR